MEREKRWFSRSSFSAAGPGPNRTRYPFWNRSAQDFLRRRALCRVCARIPPFGLRYTRILLGIMTGSESALVVRLIPVFPVERESFEGSKTGT